MSIIKNWNVRRQFHFIWPLIFHHSECVCEWEKSSENIDWGVMNTFGKANSQIRNLQIMRMTVSQVLWLYYFISGLPMWHSGKESIWQCRRCKRHGFDPWVRKIPWSRKWQPAPVFWPGKFHGQRCLVSYSPWGGKHSHKTKHVHIPQVSQALWLC